MADGAQLALSHVDVLKFGYYGNLVWSSFWGFNAAINVVRNPPSVPDGGHYRADEGVPYNRPTPRGPSSIMST